MRVMGIDPGFGGGVALVRDGKLHFAGDMPVGSAVKDRKKRFVDVAELRGLIEFWAPTVAVVERVSSAPGQGVSSTFKFGYGAGQIHGLLTGMGVPVVLPAPVVWKGALRLGGGDAGKKQAREMAIRLWPDSAELFARARDDGRAEAALLAHWGVLSGQVLACGPQVSKA